MKAKMIKIPVFLLLVAICTGCSLSYRLNQPAGSHYQYDSGHNKPVALLVVDKRTETDFFTATSNLANVNLKLQNVDDPIHWLSQALKNEFLSRGIEIQVYTNKIDNHADLVLYVTDYQIINYRASGFTPWVSYHLFNSELTAGKHSIPIRAYFLYGKVPVWSMDEIQGPCIDMPMSILVKEIASKINRSALNYSVSNKKIEEINDKINEELNNNDTNTYISILDLGGSNNPAAMQMLHNLSTVENTLFRACALSSIGILGAQNEFNFLKDKYNEYSDIDRFMALKSIGDIGTAEAIEFLKNVIDDPQNEGEYGIQYCVDLYTKEVGNHHIPTSAMKMSNIKEDKTVEIVRNENTLVEDIKHEYSVKKDTKSINLVVNEGRKLTKVYGNRGDLIRKEPKQLIKSIFEKELKMLGYRIDSNAPVKYQIEINKCDLDVFGGRGTPLSATIDLNVQIKSIEKSFVAEKKFSETYSKFVGEQQFTGDANEVLNKCIDEIVQKIGKDINLVTAINNLYAQ